MSSVLSEAAKAREKSIALSNVEYAGQLASSLKEHGAQLEKLYKVLQKSTSDGVDDDGFYTNLFSVLDKKHKWYERAQVQGCEKIKCHPPKMIFLTKSIHLV